MNYIKSRKYDFNILMANCGKRVIKCLKKIIVKIVDYKTPKLIIIRLKDELGHKLNIWI